MSIKSYEEITNKSNLTDINESVFKANNVFKVKTIVEVPTSVVNAFIKKVKDVKGPDIMDQWSQTDIAELIVNYISSNYVTADNVPVEALTGDIKDQTIQAVQPVEPLVQAQPVAQPLVQAQPEVQAQPVQTELPEGSIQ